ncbi:hypothetical protein MA6G0728S_4620 [Mycobacteroides abscessus 6G-0728-S]|nr:hypothetical protein MA6G0728S_4620 [Mycobacteroides abscessus 6G-0728-S]
MHQSQNQKRCGAQKCNTNPDMRKMRGSSTVGLPVHQITHGDHVEDFSTTFPRSD